MDLQVFESKKEIAAIGGGNGRALAADIINDEGNFEEVIESVNDPEEIVKMGAGAQFFVVHLKRYKESYNRAVVLKGYLRAKLNELKKQSGQSDREFSSRLGVSRDEVRKASRIKSVEEIKVIEAEAKESGSKIKTKDLLHPKEPSTPSTVHLPYYIRQAAINFSEAASLLEEACKVCNGKVELAVSLEWYSAEARKFSVEMEKKIKEYK